MDFSGFEKLSLVDFDNKLTCTLFVAGCPFRCPYCHNGDLVLHPDRAPRIPFEEILAYLKKRQGVLDAVCLSGGEITLMPDLEEKAKAIKELGYAIKLDTNGISPKRVHGLIEAGLIDYVAMDIKNAPGKYSYTAGTEVSLDLIQETIDLLRKTKTPHEFRTTIVEEFHTHEDMVRMGQWMKGDDKFFLQKYTDSENCISHGFHAISPQKAKEFIEILKECLPNVALRGYDD